MVIASQFIDMGKIERRWKGRFAKEKLLKNLEEESLRIDQVHIKNCTNHSKYSYPLLSM